MEKNKKYITRTTGVEWDPFMKHGGTYGLRCVSMTKAHTVRLVFKHLGI